MSFLQAVDRAAGVAVCNWLSNGGNAVLSTFVVRGLLTPGAQLPSAAAGLGLLALNYGCSFDPNKGTGDTNLPGIPSGTCIKIAPGGGYIRVWQRHATNGDGKMFDCLEITRTRLAFANDGGGRAVYEAFYIDRAGVAQGPWSYYVGGPEGFSLVTTVHFGTCGGSPAFAPTLPPVVHQDGDTNCNYNLELLAWHSDAGGRVTPVIKVSPASSRSSGGVIGGCNFNPVIYVGPPGGGGGGGGTVIPWSPGPDGPNGQPWWTELIDNILGGAVEAALDKIFETKFQPDTYRLVSVCETDAQGEPISEAREVSIPALPAFEAVVARVDALTQLIQGVKDFKQPICEPLIPETDGRSISIHFRSTAKSPNGNQRLRKEFRYKDRSGAPLEQHREHWRDFTWQSGPVMVISKGAPWGKPQVWASSRAEGIRVLRHAAAIAGVDLDAQGHAFVSRTIENARYGPQLTMAVDRDAAGRLWVADRNGPSGFPEVS